MRLGYIKNVPQGTGFLLIIESIQRICSSANKSGKLFENLLQYHYVRENLMDVFGE